MQTLPDEGFVRLKQIIGDRKKDIAAPIPVSRSDWWIGVKNGTYPQPIKISPRITVWKVSDIRDLIKKIESEGVK